MPVSPSFSLQDSQIFVTLFNSTHSILQEEKEKLVCITNYKAQEPGEISVNEGDILEALDNIGSESVMVCSVSTGVVGWLPRVLIIKAAEEDMKKAPKTAKGKEKEALHQRE